METVKEVFDRLTVTFKKSIFDHMDELYEINKNNPELFNELFKMISPNQTIEEFINDWKEFKATHDNETCEKRIHEMQKINPQLLSYCLVFMDLVKEKEKEQKRLEREAKYGVAP